MNYISEIFKKYDKNVKEQNKQNENKNTKIKNRVKIILIGIIAGIICGLFSSGGGLIFVLAFSSFLGLNEKEARATTIFCMLPIIVITGIIYNNNIKIDYVLGIKCAIGGVVGSLIGSYLLNKINEKYLDLIFIIFLIYCIVRMIWS